MRDKRRELLEAYEKWKINLYGLPPFDKPVPEFDLAHIDSFLSSLPSDQGDGCSPEEAAQWVIYNRYPKPGEERMTDTEMYHLLIAKLKGEFPFAPLDTNKQKS